MSYSLSEHVRPHEVGHPGHLVHIHTFLCVQLPHQGGKSAEGSSSRTATPEGRRHSLKTSLLLCNNVSNTSHLMGLMDLSYWHSEEAESWDTYSSCTTTGPSVELLASFTMPMSSKVLLMGPSGLGQRGQR